MSTLIVDTVQTDTIKDEAGAFEHARLVQVVNLISSTTATGTTRSLADNTIPQNDEGVEFMTLAITPTHASNKLLIQVVIELGHSVDQTQTVVALFQDSTAGALSATAQWAPATANRPYTVALNHYMAAGQTSETTFKIRAGSTNAGTQRFNSAASAQFGGGVCGSSITISEIRV